jgi:Ca2+-binding EF-hand superfamily protein
VKDGFDKIYGELSDAKVEEVFNAVDTDGSGKIEYSEWLVATIDRENVLSE